MGSSGGSRFLWRGSRKFRQAELLWVLELVFRLLLSWTTRQHKPVSWVRVVQDRSEPDEQAGPLQVEWIGGR